MPRLRQRSLVAIGVAAVVAGLVLTSPDDPSTDETPLAASPVTAASDVATSSAPSPASTPTPSARASQALAADSAEPVPATSSRSKAQGRAAAARRLLDRLPVAERRRSGDYERDRFGSSWIDTDGNGCNQRDDVLRRDAVKGSVTLAADGCDVLGGEWLDPYTGQRHLLPDIKDPAQAQAVQIDHVVPLSEAWQSGAREWTDDRRREFANDLSALQATDGPTNASKGDSDPAAWRPRKGFQCRYAEVWIGIKARWELAVDPSERVALEEMLAFCA